MHSRPSPVFEDSPRSLRADWKWLLGWGLAVYAVNLAARLADLANWTHPGLKVGGEYIQATHDSYFWLAAAEGVRPAFQSVMADFTALGASVLGMSPGQFAFFAPAFLSGLVAVVVLLWGWLLAGRGGGLLAGMAGSLAMGFVARSRLGYYDTDPFTLLFPLLTAWLLACLLSGRIREDWRFWRAAPDNAARPTPLPTLLLLGLGFGLLARFGGWWHYDIVTVTKLLFWGAVGMVLLLGRRGEKPGLLLALGVFGLAAFLGGWELERLDDMFLFGAPTVFKQRGWVGFVLAALVAGGLVLLKRPLSRPRTGWLSAVALLLFMAFATDQFAPFFLGLSKLFFYLKPAADPVAQVAQASGETVAGPAFPSVAQSIIEAKGAAVWDLMKRLSPFGWLSLAGIPGYLLVLALRPRAVFLLPLFLLGIASVVLGNRFAMFGAPAVLLGVGIPAAWALDWWLDRWTKRRPAMSARPWFKPAVLAGLGLVFAASVAVRLADMNPTPVVDKPHVESLIALGEEAGGEGMVWTWWDWGYATQYYAGMMTVNDGGRHDGRYMYPVAKVFATSSMGQANRLIRYTAAQDYDPAAVWDAMPAKEAAALIDSLRYGTLETPDIEPQYLVVGWFNFRLMEWITRFGLWDLAEGAQGEGVAERIRGFRFDPNRAAVVFQNGRAIPVSSVDSMEPGLVHHKDYFGRTGPHLIVNKHRGDAFLMDDTAYHSVMVQLMLADPSSVSEYFELVYDGLPHGRIYRVVGS